MRADAIRDYGAWRALVADVVRRGRDAGAFAPRLAPEHVAVLTIALVDGVGIPLALGDPQITADGAVADVLARCATCCTRPGKPASPRPRPHLPRWSHHPHLKHGMPCCGVLAVLSHP
jgi:BetI-type transcriptional repressor, C-terminal